MSLPDLESVDAGVWSVHAADVEEPKADELKAGAEVPNPEENVEVFGANGLELGVVLGKGLADDLWIIAEDADGGSVAERTNAGNHDCKS